MTIAATISQNIEQVVATIDPDTSAVTATVETTTEVVTATVVQNASIEITGDGGTYTPVATDLVLTADGPDTYDPPSGQTVIYLPSATLRYRLSSLSGPLFPGIHYTRSGNQITLLTGDISADDKFLLCEY